LAYILEMLAYKLEMLDIYIGNVWHIDWKCLAYILEMFGIYIGIV